MEFMTQEENDAPMVLHARVITGAGGGPDKTILNSPRFLAEHGYNCRCLFFRPPNDEGFQQVRDRAKKWSAKVLEVDDRGALDATIVGKSLAICREHQVNIWHAHDYKSNLLGLILSRWHPMTLVTTVHGWVERNWKTFLYHNVDRVALPFYQKIICVSPDLLESCRRMGLRQEKLIHIDNAIDTEQFRRTNAMHMAKQAMQWPENRRMILGAGRLSKEKGFDVLMQAVANLRSEGLDVGLAIAGDGNERPFLESRLRELGLQESSRLLGFQSNLMPLYEACDVFALSSLREGLPNVLLEAMAMGAPVVSTRVAGTPRLITDREHGLLVEIGSADALTSALREVLQDDSLRTRLLTNARKQIENNFSFSARMQKVVKVYQSLGITARKSGNIEQGIAESAHSCA